MPVWILPSFCCHFWLRCNELLIDDFIIRYTAYKLLKERHAPRERDISES